jgi:hypothetical protein
VPDDWPDEETDDPLRTLYKVEKWSKGCAAY